MDHGGVVVDRQAPKTVVVSKAALKAAGERATRASAKLEGRVVPTGSSTITGRRGLPRETKVVTRQTLGISDTWLPHDELDALVGGAADILHKPITKADVYDLEQATQLHAYDDLMPAAVEGSLPLDELLNPYFIRELHARMFGPVWNWAGQWRRLELNIGPAPEQIAVELRNTLGTIAYRWRHTNDWTPQQLGIAVHAETVRIHPFIDGNGRVTRVLADLVFAAAQNPTEVHYDWDLDKARYIELLRAYDRHRNPTDLATFVRVERI